ncbi:putative binding protein component of ABC iron transporter [Planctomycetes bacterium FF15]|uniref:Putative binding protein component of ABC iron transporter n=2 Tax=Bremerella alba TaxID=980252 RepID=A0A7V8V1W3_9BACT|nr:putative binding protein component of ABC iron transporter [Bremerella alba]
MGLTATACRPAAQQEVVVYTALDQEFSESHFDTFHKQTGVEVVAKYDTEANKTVGLTEALLAEKDRPRCDVFWNNEILNTLRLQKAGLLAAYQPKHQDQYPASFRSANGFWFGFAARARILLVNTDLLAEGKRPTSVFDLADEKWKDQGGYAKPMFGTTATHAAVLFAELGEDRAKEFFTQLQSYAKMLPGNKQVAQAVSRGEIAFGLTDTDDAMVEIQSGRPVTIVYPDQADDGLGTLFIPNTLAIIQGGPNPEAARQLVDTLLSAEVETTLARGPSAQIPLNTQLDIPLQVESPKTIRAMEVDWEASVDQWDNAAEFLREKILTN